VTTGYYHGHSFSTRREIQYGDLVGADPCGVFHRYHANVEVTLSLGPPDPRAEQIAEVQAGAFDIVCEEAGPGVAVRDVNARLREHYKRHGLWESREWIGGYELGISFAPDWVGEWIFDAEDVAAEGTFEHGLVTNFEASAPLAMNDTMVVGPTGVRMLSAHPHQILIAQS
jgi:Xaa-Pro aminopeptidase